MKNFWCIGVFCVLVACGENKKGPENIIPRDKFVPLLIRMHILDAEITFRQDNMNPETISKDYSRYENLLKQYGTDSAALARTFDHYSTHQQELIDIYTEVKDSLIERAKKTVKAP